MRWYKKLVAPVPGDMVANGASAVSQALRAGSGVVLSLEPRRELFPWLPGYRWRKWAVQAYQQGRQAYRRAWYRYQVAYGLARPAQRGGRVEPGLGAGSAPAQPAAAVSGGLAGVVHGVE